MRRTAFYNPRVNEFGLIDRYFRRVPGDSSVRIGIGDDAAVVMPAAGMELAFSVDMLVEGRHFLPGTDPERLGHKALAVNLSDMAAMGATPRFALLSGALPDANEAWLFAFMAGFDALARAHGVELIGGDTTRGPRNLCVTIVGELPAGTALTRGGAQSGDDVYVSGVLGDAALALAMLQGRTSLAPDAASVAQLRLEAPVPRVTLGVALRGVATAALDLSDGLTGDLGHLLTDSGVGAVIDVGVIPCSPALAGKLAGDERALALACLLAGGDDYELCFTAAPALRERIAAIAASLQIPLTRIGGVGPGAGLTVRDEGGTPISLLPAAFDHFA